jgi:hypothetical protein
VPVVWQRTIHKIAEAGEIREQNQRSMGPPRAGAVEDARTHAPLAPTLDAHGHRSPGQKPGAFSSHTHAIQYAENANQRGG